MKIKMFSLFDTKAEAFGVPFFMVQRAMAKRAMMDLANDSTTLVSKHREDFILYEIGEFDDSIGTLTPHAIPVNLGITPTSISAVDSVMQNNGSAELLDLSFINNKK